MASVYQASGSVRKPSCSRPIDAALTYQLPACQATSFAFTCCAMCPSVERRLYCQDTYVGSWTMFRTPSQAPSVSCTTMYRIRCEAGRFPRSWLP